MSDITEISSIEELIEYEDQMTDAIIDSIKTSMYSPEALEAKGISIIEKMIQSEVDRLNKAKGLSLTDKFACKLYGDTDGYAYQEECRNLWNWSVNDLYQPMDEWKKGLDHFPTEEEFLEELYKHTYDVTYPEEEEA